MVKGERQLLQQQVDQLQNLNERRAKELSDLQELYLLDKRKNREMITSLLRDVAEASTVLDGRGEDNQGLPDGTYEITDDDFTRARVHLSNLRCEARTLGRQRDVLERAEREARDEVQSSARDLAHLRSRLAQVNTCAALTNVTPPWEWW